ncbi:MAG: penicillin-binding protein [Gammaproteobacteria bacterium]|nr:penicillin-binding protein [Gammaproteobacteria bacterium]
MSERGSCWGRTLLALSGLLAGAAAVHAQPAAGLTPDSFAAIDRIFEEFRLDAHIPGMVYGIVADGRLVHVGTFGVQDLETRRAVSADTLFRIASMTKSFTALTVLKLRDDGKVRLDALAEEYVPELRGWKYPTDDSPRIRVRDLLNHAAGFVTDDPWGDRQTPLPEQDFTRLLREGVPFTRAPGMAYEYSNLGYALVGRIVTNVSKQPYAETIARTLLQPLGMEASGFVADAAPRERRALGYRWEDDAWRPEPALAHGAFGAMGGLQTSANDYAKWVAFLLSAWPPRDGAERGPVRRATVRELAQGSNYPRIRARFGHTGKDACRQAVTYGMGMIVAVDCDLGFTLSHGGGYPGYGSHVLLLPDRGVGIFAFANRTYAGPSAPVWDAAMALYKAGLLAERPLPVSADLENAYRAAGALYAAGGVAAAGDLLAMNFLLDRSADGWARDIASLKAQVGECATAEPAAVGATGALSATGGLSATGALTGNFTWRCAHGRVQGSLELAPTRPPRIQELKLSAIAP